MEYTTFLSPVIKKLVDLLADEVNLLGGVHKEAKSLKDELEIIEPFLRDSEAKSDRGEVNEATKTWLKQLREEAEHIEFVIDEYNYGLSKTSNARGCQRGFTDALHTAFSLKPRHHIASEIRDIKDSLCEIKDRGQSFALRPFEQESSSRVVDPRIDALFVRDDEVVGIDLAVMELVRDLVEGQPSRKVISILGEGGIGKTTLVKKVFDNAEVKSGFDFRVWINVSQSYSISKMLKALISQIHPTTVPIMGDIEELVHALRDSPFSTKRYVVVFDDVWQANFWYVINHALPNKFNKNRIIITSRNKSVAECFKVNRCDVVRELKTWSIDLARLLFCKTAFCSEGHFCPVELEALARKIVSKCQGLPLVIVAVASLLSRKEKTQFEWQLVHDYLDYCDFEDNPQLVKISKILSLSFHDLPYHLKPCLLYFGMFPGGVSIREEKLYDIWIAEGFIKPKRGKTLEEVAEEYLHELIGRNLFRLKKLKR